MSEKEVFGTEERTSIGWGMYRFALGFAAGVIFTLAVHFLGIMRVTIDIAPPADPTPTLVPTATAYICPEPSLPGVIYKSAPDVAEVHSDLILVRLYLDLATKSGDYTIALVHLREASFHLISAGEGVEGIMRLGEYPCP